MELEHFDFYGLKISTFSLSQFRDYIISNICQNHKTIIYGYSLGSIIYAKKVPEILWGNKADVSLIDGQGLFYLIKFLKFKVQMGLSIPGSVNEILKIANQNCFSIILYGSDSDTNNIASNNIINNFPSINVLKGIDGYSHTIEESIDIINIYKPDILLIGISSPMKEIIAFKHKEKLNTNIIIPCGGMIDVLAGKTKQTSTILKKMGLASLIRVIQEPKRLYKRYLFLYFNIFFNFLPRFFYSVIFKKGRFTIPQLLNIKDI
jgi:N-acetylglucosaminyldiphosphoundecaprenol N-acetyl-beta-D-mannosaminyltransferase